MNGWRAATALGRAELLLLRRNSTVLIASTVVPLAMTLGGVILGRDVGAGIGWSNLLALLLTLVLGTGVYMTSTLTLTARREDLYLKRLRTGEAPDAAVVTGVLAPTVIGGLVQAVVAVVAVIAVSDIAPARPVLLVAAAVLGLLLAVLAGAATTALVRTTQQADSATLPFFAVLVLSAVWAVYAQGAPGLHQLLPGGALLSTVRGGLESGAGEDGLTGLGVLVVWCLVCALVISRRFRWEPRR